MVSLYADGSGCISIPNNNIGITSGVNSTFAGIDIEYTSSVGGGSLIIEEGEKISSLRWITNYIAVGLKNITNRIHTLTNSEGVRIPV